MLNIILGSLVALVVISTLLLGTIICYLLTKPTALYTPVDSINVIVCSVLIQTAWRVGITFGSAILFGPFSVHMSDIVAKINYVFFCLLIVCGKFQQGGGCFICFWPAYCRIVSSYCQTFVHFPLIHDGLLAWQSDCHTVRVVCDFCDFAGFCFWLKIWISWRFDFQITFWRYRGCSCINVTTWTGSFLCCLVLASFSRWIWHRFGIQNSNPLVRKCTASCLQWAKFELRYWTTRIRNGARESYIIIGSLWWVEPALLPVCWQPLLAYDLSWPHLFRQFLSPWSYPWLSTLSIAPCSLCLSFLELPTWKVGLVTFSVDVSRFTGSERFEFFLILKYTVYILTEMRAGLRWFQSCFIVMFWTEHSMLSWVARNGDTQQSSKQNASVILPFYCKDLNSIRNRIRQEIIKPDYRKHLRPPSVDVVICPIKESESGRRPFSACRLLPNRSQKPWV